MLYRSVSLTEQGEFRKSSIRFEHNNQRSKCNSRIRSSFFVRSILRILFRYGLFGVLIQSISIPIHSLCEFSMGQAIRKDVDCQDSLPLPQEVPLSFRVLPEFALEDVIEYHFYVIRQVGTYIATTSIGSDVVVFNSNSPDSLELSGKTELFMWALTFLTSTWYIKNPFLKAKINEVGFGPHEPIFYMLSLCLGYLLWNSQLWSRAEWRFRQYFEYSPICLETPHACADVVLYRYVYNHILNDSFR